MKKLFTAMLMVCVSMLFSMSPAMADGWDAPESFLSYQAVKNGSTQTMVNASIGNGSGDISIAKATPSKDINSCANCHVNATSDSLTAKQPERTKSLYSDKRLSTVVSMFKPRNPFRRE